MQFRKPVKYLLAVLLVAFIALVLFWGADLLLRPFLPAPKPIYGVTFSVHYAKELGLDPEKVFTQTLDDLGAKNLRIPVYWSDIEASEGEFDFAVYDRLLDMAAARNAQVILAIGYKVPRWPECFVPSWGTGLEKEKLQAKILTVTEETVNHFKNRPEIVSWQVENEPLLDFGICRMLGKPFLKEEVNLVRSLDSRPIVLTDSGELGFWVTALQSSNTMGTSLYRIVWNPILGYFRYPFPPLYYDLKAKITKQLFAPGSSGVFVSELQAEPWAPGKSLSEVPISDQVKLFSMGDFKEVVDFTRWTRLSEQYLWGVEWWYYMKLNGHPGYWEYAKTLFN